MKLGILSVALMILISCGLAEAQSDITFLGEFCVVDDSVMGRPPLPLFQVGVLQYGDNHLALNGNWLGGIPEPIYGTAMIVGDNIVSTLTASLVSDTYGTSYSVMYLAVNSATMRGTITYMVTTFSPTPSQQAATTGSIYVVPCGP